MEVLMTLFNATALSLVAHTLPFMDNAKGGLDSMQKAQQHFAKEALGLPKEVRGEIATAELGIIDFALKHKISVLLLHHRMSNNKLDTLTPTMMGWPSAPDGSTMKERDQAILDSLDIAIKVDNFNNLHYEHAKAHLKNRVQLKQETRWLEDHLTLTPIGCLRDLKPCWGIERALMKLPANVAR